MADRYEMELGLNISEFLKGLNTLEQRVSAINNKMASKVGKLPVLSQSAIEQYNAPKINQTRAGAQQYAKFAASVAMQPAVALRLGTGARFGNQTKDDKRLFEASIKDALANLTNAFGGKVSPSIKKDFEAQFTATFGQIFSDLRKSGFSGEKLAAEYRKIARPNLEPLAGGSPISVMGTGTAGFEASRRRIEEAASVRVSAGNIREENERNLLRIAAKDLTAAELEKRQVMRLAKIKEIKHQRGGGGEIPYENPVTNSRNYMGAAEEITMRLERAIVNLTIMTDEVFSETMVNVDLANKYYGRLQEIMAREAMLTDKQFRALTHRYNINEKQEEVASLKSKLADGEYKAVAQEARILKSRLGRETRIPPEEAAERRVDSAGYRARTSGLLVQDEALRQEYVNNTVQAQQAEEELRQALREAKLNTTKDNALRLKNATLNVLESILGREAANTAMGSLLNDPELSARQASGDADKVTNSKRRKNNATREAMSRKEYLLAQEDETILALEKQLADLGTKLNSAEAIALQRRIAQSRAYIAEISALPAAVAADLYSGKAAREASKYSAIRANPAISERLVSSKAETRAIKAELKAAADERTLSDQRYINAMALGEKNKLVSRSLETAARANALRDFVADPERYNSFINDKNSISLLERKLAAEQRAAFLNDPEYATVTLQEQLNAIRAKNIAKQAEVSNEELMALRVQQRMLEIQDRQIEARINQQAMVNLTGRGGGRISGFLGRLGATGGGGGGGNFSQLAGDPGGFFLGGGLSTLKYGAASTVMYGGFRVISEAVKDSEELNITLSKLESQLDAVDSSGEAFVRMKDNIIDLSKETGVMANEIAKMAAKIQGAFGQMEYDPNDPTGSMGGLRGNDDRIRYNTDAVDRQIEAVTKLVKVTGLTEKEVSDEMMAASISFGAGADLIGDVIVKLEEATGVASGEIATLIGDVGPSAREAGFALEEFAAIGASALQKTSVGPAAIAEQMGRIIASMNQDAEKYFQLAYDNQKQLMESGDYDAFIKAIQDRDPSAIFRVMQRNYENWSKASQDFTIQMLGGSRQANVVRALFSNPEGTARNTKAAEDSSGAMERRLEKMDKKMSIVLSKLDMAFNDIVRKFLDAGIMDAVINLASTFGTIVKVLGEIVGIWSKFDQALGGSLSTITGFAIQAALIKGIITAIQLMGNTGRGQRAAGLAGDFISGIGFGGRGKMPNIPSATGFIQPFIGPLPQSRMPIQATRMQRFNQIRQTRGLAGVQAGLSAAGAGLGTAGKGLMAAVGGPVGLGFAGITAATMAYSALKNSLEEDRSAVAELMAEKLDSKESANSLRAQADRLRDQESNFTRLKNVFSEGYLTKAEGLDIAADFKEVEDSTNKLIEIGNIEPAQVQRIMRGYEGVADTFSGDALMFDRLLELDGMRERLIGGATAAFSDKTLNFTRTGSKNLADELGMTPEELFNITGFSDISSALIDNSIDFDEYWRLVFEKAGFTELSNALNESNPAQALSDLIRDEETDQQTKEVAVEYLNQLAKYKKDVINKAYNDAKELGKLALNDDVTISTQAIDALRSRYESGVGTFSDYISALDRLIDNLEGSDEADVERIIELKNQRAAALAENLKSASDRLLELDALIYGGDERGQLQTIAANLELLGNKDFDSGDERFNAAKSILQAQRALLDKMVDEAESVEEINRLINEGIQIPLPAAVEWAATGVLATDDYRKLAESFGQLEENLDEIAAATTPKKMNVNDYKAAITKKIGTFNPDEILRTVLTEVASTGKVSEATVQKYTGIWQTLRGYLKDSDLPQATRDALTGSVAFIEKLFKDIRILAIQQKLTDLDQKGQKLGVIGKVATAAQRGILNAQLRQAQAASANPFGAQINTTMYADPESAEKAARDLAKETKEKQEDLASARLEIAKALAEDEGNLIEVARIGVQQAQAALNFLRQTGGSQAEIMRAQAAIISARGALREAIAEQRDAQVELLKVVMGKDDPLLNAQFDLNLAVVQEGEARGVKAKTEAAIARIEAERAVAAEIADVRLAQMELRRVQLQAIDDEVGAAFVDSQIAQQELADAISRGAGKAEIARLQGSLISADKNVRDTLLQSKLDEYDYLLNTGQLTQRQYVEYLEGLKSTLDPASKQFKDLERQLYSLKQSIGADLQMNLPTNLSLPTLYEARRLNQTGAMNNGSAQSTIGYQDNRNMDVQIVVNKDMSEEQVVSVLSNALGVGRNALTTEKRY